MCNTCATLAARNETLQAEVGQLKSQLYGFGWLAPEALRLTRTESLILAALLSNSKADSRRIIPEWLLYDAAYSEKNVDHAAGSNIIHVFISKLRTKFKPFGLSIETIWGQGYRLPVETRERLLNWNTQVEQAA